MSLSSLLLGHGSLETECWVNFHPPQKKTSILEIFSNLLNKNAGEGFCDDEIQREDWGGEFFVSTGSHAKKGAILLLYFWESFP